jgi:sporulation-control protein spo0M
VPAVLNLATTPGQAGMINGAIFTGSTADLVSGSGNIDSFVRLETTGVEQGYNSNDNSDPLNEEGNTNTFNHSLQLSALPVVFKGGTAYYEFVLDANQTNDNPYLSLDELRMYVSPSSTLNSYDPTTGHLNRLPPVYDMDGGLDPNDSTYVALNINFNPGSGRPDLFVDVPVAAFGSDLSQYVYLYSKFGVQDLNDQFITGDTTDTKNGGSANDGFEEWARGIGQPVQLHSTVATSIVDESTGQSGVTSINAGDIIHDTATVTPPTTPPNPTPTGTVTYYFYDRSNPVFGITTPDSTQTVNLSNGLVPNSASIQPPSGAHSYIAAYSGDAVYIGTASPIEPLTVNKVSPTIGTSASATAGGVVGSAVLSDSVTVSGGYNPTGTVSFTLTQPDNTTISVGTVTINGDGTYALATTVPGTEIGTYTWHASYAGDAFNNGAVDNGTNESVSIIKATPSISTSASETAGGVVGTAVLSDSVTVTGGDNPTGTVTFTLTAPDNSTTTVGTVAVNGDGTYNLATTVLAIQVGTYTWHASYAGDGLNNGAVDNGQNESLTTVKASPSISTSASETAGGVVGTAVLSDSVTVTGGDSPTGTVTFTLDQPDGTTITVGTVTISGDGNYDLATTVTATEVGTYKWHASYAGDSLNNGAVDDGSNESLTTVKASPSISTSASETAGGVVGTAVLIDSVTVTGGDSPTGTVTFTLDQPDGTTITVGTVTISGDGNYDLATTATATEVGTYKWHASYAGDSLNNGAVDDGSNESLTTVKASPSVTTKASQTANSASANYISLNDTATVSGGYKVTGGTITFTLTLPDNTTVTVGSVSVTGDGDYNAPTFTATQLGTYTWHASYSGDGLNNGAIDNGQNESVIVTTAALGDVVWWDVNQDGLQTTGEPGITGASVHIQGTDVFGNSVDQTTSTVDSIYLYNGVAYTDPTDSNVLANGVQLGFGDGIIYGGLSAVTSSNLNIIAVADPYLFSGLTPGNYHVTFTGPTDPVDGAVFSFTGRDVGDPGNDQIDSDADGNGVVGSVITPITVTSGEVNLTIDAGMNTKPKITTNAKETAAGVVGVSVLSDKASLHGGYKPGGTIDFTLTAPDGTTTDEGTVTVSGNGDYSAPTSVTATQVGTYTWHAIYSGDGLNPGAQDDGTNEAVTTVKASPSISTNASETAGGVVGTAALSDSVTVTGGDNPSGTVTFTLTAPDNTTTTVGTVTVSGDSTYNFSTTVVATQVGTYTWHASYSGDGLNNGAIDDGSNESLNVVKASPSISTNASESTGNIGDVLTDKATLSGGYMVNGGTIHFTLTTPDNVVHDEGTVTVNNGDGTYTSPGSFTATMAGAYLWSATYSGNATNNSAIDNGVGESTAITNVTFSISGFKFDDLNADGVWESGEKKLSGWTIQLYMETNGIAGLQTGTGGDKLVGSTVTDSNGNYSFTNLAPGTYYVREVLQSGWTQIAGDHDFVNVSTNQTDNFANAEVLGKNMAATLGFWSNKGQTLIKSSTFGTGSALANFLKVTYGSVFTTGGGTLFTGSTNADVAAYFVKLKGSHSQVDNLRVQILAVALDVWATTTGEGWSTAAGGSASYGFKQDSFGNGTGTIVINVGNNGAAFGVANNTWLTVNQLLALANSRWSTILANTSLIDEANIVFNGINEHGDII